MSTAPRHNASLVLDDNLAAGRAGKVAISTPTEQITYAQLAARTAQAGHLLRSRGVEAGQRVLLVLDDTPAFPVLFLAAMRIGAVPVPVNPLDKPEHFAHYLAESDARLCVVEPSRRDALAAAGSCALLDTDELPALLAEQPPDLAPAATHADDTAFWLYSSGSTGLPKGVVHRHRAMAVTFEAYARHVLAITQHDICYSTTPLFHSYGFGNALTYPLSAGATTVLVPTLRTAAHPALRPLHVVRTAARTLARHRPTLFFSVPTLYRAMLAEPAIDVASVRMCICGGEPLAPSTAARWSERFGLDLVECVGSTEMLHAYCSNRPGDIHPGTTGRPVPGYELRIDDDGELLVKGDSRTAGYWRQPERTKQRMRGEWFATGDRFHVDEQGCYVYEGRVDDMLKVGGLWASPTDVEACLTAHAAVLEAAVVSAQIDGASRCVAFVVAAEGADASPQLAEELRRWCRGRLLAHECPHHVRFVADLPRTDTGKLQRFKLRDAAGAIETGSAGRHRTPAASRPASERES